MPNPSDGAPLEGDVGGFPPPLCIPCLAMQPMNSFVGITNKYAKP